MTKKILFPKLVGEVPEIDCKTVFALFQSEDRKSIQFIDVRRPDEFTGELGHIESAQLFTLGNEFNHFLKSQSEKNSPIVFICRSGARSGAATQEALLKGFTQVANMTGGMIEWNKIGLEVVK